MPRPAKPKPNGVALGFEEQLWKSADALRGSMDAGEYKHVVLGLIFLKYISDSFEKRHAELEAEDLDPEDPDEYQAEGVFWVPPGARWELIQASAKQETIGITIDGAMESIEKHNPTLRDVLPKNYQRPSLDKTALGSVVDLIAGIGFREADDTKQDVLGRVYEYFLGQFASSEGKKGGEFYTPASVVRVLVGMLAPYHGRVYDPCCGSGGLFVQSEKFVEAHGGKRGDIAIYGQEWNHTTWRLAKMNLALRGIDANLGKHNADTFMENLHPDLKADYVLANPPFNVSDWKGQFLRDDLRWQYGVPPVGNANYAWVQHMLHHLGPNGTAGFVLANGSLSSNQSGEGEIRKNIINADLVDCIVAMPGQLFYSTQIPVSLWFLAKNKANGKGESGHDLKDRRGETLFIDARKLGYMADRTHRDLSDDDIDRITDTYHAWRGDLRADYKDIPGFCKSSPTAEIATHDYVLTPGRYVGSEMPEFDQESFDETLSMLRERLKAQFESSRVLEATIEEWLDKIATTND